LKKKERLRQQAMAPAGIKSLKNRVQARQGRAKEQLIGKKKHEEAMKEMARRKTETKQQKSAAMSSKVGTGGRGAGGAKMAIPKKGIGAGIHNKNPHLQEFQQMKKGYQKRREDMDKKSIEPKEKTPLERRIQSQTAPVYNSRVLPQMGGGGKGAPKVSTTGAGMTRRTNNSQLPTRKPRQDASAVSSVPLPPIAVTGMGGLRAIRAGHR